MRKMMISDEYWFETAELYVDAQRVIATIYLIEAMPDWMEEVTHHYRDILVRHICEKRGFDIDVNPEYYEILEDVLCEKMVNECEPYHKERPHRAPACREYVEELYQYLMELPIVITEGE